MLSSKQVNTGRLRFLEYVPNCPVVLENKVHSAIARSLRTWIHIHGL